VTILTPNPTLSASNQCAALTNFAFVAKKQLVSSFKIAMLSGSAGYRIHNLRDLNIVENGLGRNFGHFVACGACSYSNLMTT